MLIMDRLNLGKMFKVPDSMKQRIKTVDASSSSADERRSYKRIRSYNLVKYALKSGFENNWISNLKDISEGGVQFNARNTVDQNSILKISINLGEFNHQVDALAKAVWVKSERVRGALVHHVGACFLDIRESDRLMIRDLAYCN